MKLTIFLIIFSTVCFADVYNAIAEVESNNNDYTFNSKEQAMGRYQIRPVYLKDVNRISGRNYTMDDTLDAQTALEIVQIYTEYYAKVYSERTGLPVTDEVIARIHNGGGYKGALKECTRKYWKKVKAVLDK